MRWAIAAVLSVVASAAFGQAQNRLLDMPPSSFKPNEGIVFAVNNRAREITIRHGELPEIDMPPMTMVFNVTDARLLAKVKPGDKVKLRAELVSGRFTVTEIHRLKPSANSDGGADARNNR